LDGDDWKVVTAYGYYACIEPITAVLDSSITLDSSSEASFVESGFLTLDCSGQRYAFSNDAASGPFTGGFVLASAHDRAAYTSNDGNVSSLVTLYSTEIPFGSNCTTLSTPFTTYALPALDNEMAVTGFSNVAYLGPLRLRAFFYSPLTDEIFFDTLE
jgi:hypothetical protein